MASGHTPPFESPPNPGLDPLQPGPKDSPRFPPPFLTPAPPGDTTYTPLTITYPPPPLAAPQAAAGVGQTAAAGRQSAILARAQGFALLPLSDTSLSLNVFASDFLPMTQQTLGDLG